MTFSIKEKQFKRLYALSLVFQLGFSLALPLVIGIGGGAWLDKKLSTSPLFVIAGLVIGLVLAAYSFYIDMLPLLKDKKNKV